MGPVSEDLYDVVVVGGGAAGLSAGLILAQAQCRMAVVDAGVPRNRFDGQMHGYLSRDGLAPQEFLRLGRQEVADAGAELIQARVTGAEREGDEQAPRFTLHTDQGHALRTRRVVVATGLTDELPAVEGLDPYWGHAVFHCPYCHGVQITSDLVVGVLAVGPDSVMEAHLLLQWAEQVILLTDDRLELTDEDRAGLDARGIAVVEGKVVSVEGDGEQLTCAVHADGSRTPLDELLIAPTVHINRDVLDLLGVEVLEESDDEGTVVPTEPSGLTSVPGVYAAGNVRANNVQVIEAAAEGLNAAVAVNASLALERARDAVRSRLDPRSAP